MDALVVTLREGVEAALVVGIILAYLGKVGKGHLRKHVYGGVAGAVIFSVVVAFGLLAIGIDPENEMVEGVIYMTSAAFVASMVVWMWRVGRRLSDNIKDKMGAITAAGTTSWQAIGIFSFTFLMVAREGVETVLFMAAISLSDASQALTFIGAVVGLALAVVFGVLFARGGIRIDLKAFFSATSIALLLLAARFFAGGLHEFEEVGLVSLGGISETVVNLVRNDVNMWVLIALVVIPVVLLTKKGGQSKAESRAA
ncbi:MAG: FTR1 family iron permease [Candidatus Aquicultorales bacterium]